jgi:hypothetical protein
MEPIRTLADYLGYKSILADVEGMIRYYARYTDDVHNDTWTSAKRRLLKTKYQSLYTKGGCKISIESASTQQINMAFANSFSKRGEGINMPDYLKTITKPWYESRIKNYEATLRSLLPSASSLNKLLAAEQLAKVENNSEKAEELHQTIEDKLSQCSKRELVDIWNSYKAAPGIQTGILIEYYRFQDLLRK